MFFEFRGIGTVDGEDDLSLESDMNLGLAGRVQFWDSKRLHFFLRQKDNVHASFEFIDDVGLQVFVEGHEGVTGATPGGKDVNDDQLGITLVEVGEEMVCIADCGGQLYLFLGSHFCTSNIRQTDEPYSSFSLKITLNTPSKKTAENERGTEVKDDGLVQNKDMR